MIWIYIFDKFIPVSELKYEDVLKTFDEDESKVFKLIKGKVIEVLGFDAKILQVNHYCSYVKGSEFLIEYFVKYEKSHEEGIVGIKIIHSENPIQLLREYYENEKSICVEV